MDPCEECDHWESVNCSACDKRTNTCCDDGWTCHKCSSTFCKRCQVKYKAKQVKIKGGYKIEMNCPVCSGDVVTDDEIVSYLLKTYKLDIDTVIAEIKKEKTEEKPKKTKNSVSKETSKTSKKTKTKLPKSKLEESTETIKPPKETKTVKKSSKKTNETEKTDEEPAKKPPTKKNTKTKSPKVKAKPKTSKAGKKPTKEKTK